MFETGHSVRIFASTCFRWLGHAGCANGSNPGNAKVARTDDAVSPVDAAAKVAAGTRVLVTDGTADTNIPVSTISPLASALKGAGTTGPELNVLTGINHLLHEPGTADNDAVLAPSVVAALKAWAQPFAAAG